MNSSQLDGYLAAVKAAQQEYQFTAPTFAQLQRLCPHLSPQAIANILASPKTVIFALPPVLVRDAFHVAEFTPADPSRRRPAALRIDPYSTSVAKDFARNGQYRDEAHKFALKNWSDRLMKKTWSHAQVVYLENPAFGKFVDESHTVPSLVHYIWVGLKGKVVLDKFRMMEEWERSIAVASLDPVAGVEIIGNHGPLTAFNCSLCGGGLAHDRCTGCQTVVSDKIYNSYRVSWTTPLPPRLMTLLNEAGHKFSPKAA